MPSPNTSPADNVPLNTVAYSPVKLEPTFKRPKEKATTAEAILKAWNKYWMYELGACLLSLIFFIGIIAVLKKFDHHRLPTWPYGLTINTIVSALATALGSALSVPISEGLSQQKWLWFRQPRTISDIETYDSATRGPLGAFQFLFRLRGLHLGTVGSFVTIIALGVSPFVQQVISYQTQNTILSFNATIPRSNQFDLQGGGNHLEPFVNTTTQAAVFNGIFNPNDVSIQVKPDCATGNCTFSEPYSSLAVCSSCSNITKYIEQTIYESWTEENKTYYRYNYTLPNGLNIMDSGLLFVNTSGSAVGLNTVWSGFGDPLSILSVISSTNDAISDPDTTATIIGPWAAQCVLYFCINTYTSVVVNGDLEEETISTYFNESARIGDDGYKLTQQPCLAKLESRNLTYSVPDNETQEAVYSTCDFIIDPYVFGAMQAWLPSVFNFAQNGLNFEFVIYNNNNSNFEWVETLMSRVAKSLTTNIRTYGKGPPAFGISSTPETYISVQWQWLTLPACVVFLTIFFLLITILQNRGTEAWKSSSLALLFAAHVRDEQDRGLSELHRVEWVAGGRYAVLRKTGEGNILLTSEID